ncbi:MAG TPA: DUF3703 domain-containing protein [Gammaproteobacteria bacterium]|nr:DUF3703 domain-containing protein [Gammaproteobacteria bacterium]
MREVAGQILRMAASVGSLVGVLPIGNTGRATVSAFKPMPIPALLDGISQDEPAVEHRHQRHDLRCLRWQSRARPQEATRRHRRQR